MTKTQPRRRRRSVRQWILIVVGIVLALITLCNALTTLVKAAQELLSALGIM